LGIALWIPTGLTIAALAVTSTRTQSASERGPYWEAAS